MNSQLAGVVDELGALEKELAPYAVKQARVEQLRRLIRTEYSDKPAEQTFEVAGAKYAAILGPRGNERVVDYPKLWKLAPAAAIKAIATVTLKALEGAVAANVLAAVVGTKPIGTRTLRVIERPA